MNLALLLLAAAAAAASAPPADTAIAEPNPSRMSRAEIRAFNEQVGEGHPLYIRCRRDVEIGSLAKARTICRTARQWADADDAGNRTARDTVRMLNETAGKIGS